MQLLFHRSVHYVLRVSVCASEDQVNEFCISFHWLSTPTFFLFITSAQLSSGQVRSGQLSVLDWQGC